MYSHTAHCDLFEKKRCVTVHGTESRDEMSERDERGKSEVESRRRARERERGEDRRIQVDSPRNLGDESDTKYMRDADRRVE